MGNDFTYDGVPGEHQWYDGSLRALGLHPGLAPRAVACTTPRRVYAGVEDAALFKSTDGGTSWTELSGLRKHDTGPQWQPGAGGMCLHTILQHPSDADRLYVAISAAGAFRTSDGGETWQPINKGLRSGEIPDQDSEVGHCVHRIDMHPSQPRRPLHAEALGRHAQQGRRRLLAGGQRQPAHRLRLPDRGARARGGDHLRRPDPSDSHHYPPDGKLRVYRSRTGGDEWEALTEGLPQADCYVNVLRDAMAVDQHESCGVYFGTTGGQVYASNDSGDSWAPIVRDLPAVLSVEVQTLR